jgi:hypothetical protein
MKKKQPQKVWAYKPQAPKFSTEEKAKKLERIKTIIAGHPKLSEKVSRVEMRSNRIYLYEMVEQFKIEGAVYVKPLIDDKYLELPYARITLNDVHGNDCTADWQRHNDQWMTLHTGTLAECLDNIEDDDTWY